MISEIDQNFEAKPVPTEGIVYHNIKENPFQIYGLFEPYEQERFCRMDPTIAVKASQDVAWLNYNTAGGRVRFATNSAYVVLRVKFREVSVMPHMTLCGSSGFDLYFDTEDGSHFANSFMPPFGGIQNNTYEHVIFLTSRTMRYMTIHFPLYNDVENVEIGLQEDAALLPGREYSVQKPVVYYGSSITQGACACRPGTCYEAILSREFDCDYINLGFSGSAKGEEAMVEYIANLSMSVFVCDYDNNAPTADHLRKTHRPFYTKVREKQPNLPIIFITRPNFHDDCTDDLACRAAVMDTYMYAISQKDPNVFYIDGAQFFNFPLGDNCTVDGIHPNELGFYRMAEGIKPSLQKALLGVISDVE